MTQFPLGRHVNHDPRSLDFGYPESAAAPVSVRWARKVPVFDQGNLGSCTGNAAVGCVATEPYFDTLKPGVELDENVAVAVYSAATKIDGAAGSYPPTDTGSDGLSVAKILQSRGLISGYQHAFTFDALVSALQAGPVIVGVNWYQSMFTPDSSNIVSIGAGEQPVGGHEFVLDQLIVEKGLIGATNSWGAGWGEAGRFYLTYATVQRLLSEQGDVTVFVPLSQPAPVPVPPAPVPVPVPVPVPPTPVPPAPVPVPVPPVPPIADADAQLWAGLKTWANCYHTGQNRAAAKLVKAWAAANGFTS